MVRSLLEQALMKQVLMLTAAVGLVFGVVLGFVSPQVQAKPTDSDEEFAAQNSCAVDLLQPSSVPPSCLPLAPDRVQPEWVRATPRLG
jgi:hypothetical protein